MSMLQALFLGIIQGVTEFLPVSSSGHLAILQNLWKPGANGGVLFAVFLHLGTLSAILIAFWQDIRKLLLELCKMLYEFLENLKIALINRREKEAKRYHRIVSNNYRKFVLLLFFSSLPTAAEGLLFQGLAEQASKSLLAPAMGLFLTGIVLWVADFLPSEGKIPKDISYRAAIVIGMFQGFAVFPGISRCGVTIAACLLFGANRRFAVKYSFLLAVPTILGAAVYEFVQLPGAGVSALEVGSYVLAAVAAGAVGCLCAKKMLTLVQKKQFRFFSVYCFLIGAIAVVFHFVR